MIISVVYIKIYKQIWNLTHLVLLRDSDPDVRVFSQALCKH